MGRFYEFFAGAGMARAGLGPGWSCSFANDIDRKKAASYIENWGPAGFLRADVATLSPSSLPGIADLAWASFPCQDLSLAGYGAGLEGKRSGTFWPFWRLMNGLASEGRAPIMIVLENVCGTLTSHGGGDFAAIASAIVDEGYRFGALVIDAVQFVPQSRPRLFIIATRSDAQAPPDVTQALPGHAWMTKSLVAAVDSLPRPVRNECLWWHLPEPSPRKKALADLIDDQPEGIAWHSSQETGRLLGMMSAVNRAKVEAASATGQRMVGTIYRRTRPDGSGGKTQRAEIRFDGIAGCLRTPQGGSSRQTVMVVQGRSIRSRLLAPREAARLMGLPDTYSLPNNYNEAYHLSGDGVAVPVVRHLAAHILEPVLRANATQQAVAA